MKKVKIFVGVAVLVAALVVAVVPADAHSLAVAVDLKAVKVSNFNFGSVFNLVVTGANSGLNHTFKGDSGTGNATADASVSTDLNSNSTEVMVWEMGQGPLAMNRNKGIAVAVDATLVKVDNFNLGSVNNMVFTGANSGGNVTDGIAADFLSSHRRPHRGSIDPIESNTGNAVAEADVSTKLNANSTTVAICDFENGPVAVNWQERCRRDCRKGKCQCDPIAVAVDLTAVEVCNFNAGMVLNVVGTGANTGWNNTSGGNSHTGNARADASVDTTLNTNETAVMVSESGSGALAMNKSKCGGLAVAVEADLVKVGNVNLGYVANYVITGANSGLNHTSKGDSHTGNAVALASVKNSVNSNTTFVGIIGSDGAAAVNGGSTCVDVPCVGCVDVCHSDGVVAINDGKGVAVAADVDAVSVSNTNVASVDNVVVTAANTGGNETGSSNPTCGSNCGGCPSPDSGGDSSTGNASASSTVNNTVNSNSTTVVIGGGAI